MRSYQQVLLWYYIKDNKTEKAIEHFKRGTGNAKKGNSSYAQSVRYRKYRYRQCVGRDFVVQEGQKSYAEV